MRFIDLFSGIGGFRMAMEAAELLGVIPLTVSDWEVGKYKPTQERRPLIAAIYGLPQDFINWGD